MDAVKVLSQLTEEIVNRGVVGRGKYIMPLQIDIEAVEDETAEQAVFSIRDEALDLTGSAGQKHRKARLPDFGVFIILDTAVGNAFMMESLTKAVGIVAIV